MRNLRCPRSCGGTLLSPPASNPQQRCLGVVQAGLWPPPDTVSPWSTGRTANGFKRATPYAGVMPAATAAVQSRPAWLEALDILIWPVVAVVLLLILTTQRGRLLLRPLLRRLRKLNLPGGWALELSEDAAAETYADVHSAISSYAPVLDAELTRLAHAEGVSKHLGSVVERALEASEREASGFRATVHIEDALVKAALYQLVDYYPRPEKAAGRRFSMRFGMLGRTWRLGRSEVVQEVPVDPEDLIKEWGMTLAQARTAAQGKQSFLCILLWFENQPVGLLYMDASTTRAFSEETKERLDRHDATLDLARAVGEVHKAISRKGPGLTLLVDD